MAINITGRWDLVSWYKISNQVCIFIRRYNVLFPCRIFTGERWSDANAAYINTIFHGLTTQLTPYIPFDSFQDLPCRTILRAWPNEETSACSEKGYTSWPRVYITFPVFPRKSLTGRHSECRRISSLSPRTSTHNCAISNIILAFFLSDRSLNWVSRYIICCPFLWRHLLAARRFLRRILSVISSCCLGLTFLVMGSRFDFDYFSFCCLLALVV